jgi:hypothetical protein
MIYATQDMVMRAIRARLVSVLGIPESRVYLATEPTFAEYMDFAIQITPITAGAQNELNRVGLGFVTERFAVTCFVRVASDNSVKASRQIAGVEKGVLARCQQVRAALIQNNLAGLLQIAMRFVSSGAVRRNPTAQNFASSTDIFVCSYAMPWPIAGKFRGGSDDGAPNWEDLEEGETLVSGSVDVTRTYQVQQSQAPVYLWFLIPEDMHNLGVEFSTDSGIEQFYSVDFPPPSGASLGPSTIVEDGVTYYIYRRAWPTTAASLTYRIRTL